MPVGDKEDETLIAETIAEAVEAMELCTLSDGCHHAFVVQLWWYLYKQYLSSMFGIHAPVHHFLHSANPLRHWCLHIVCQQEGSQVVGATAACGHIGGGVQRSLEQV